MDVSVKFDPASQRQFQSLIREMEQVTGRETKIVVRNVARDYAWGALRQTPISKARVKGRGFAKASWFVVLKKLGVNVSSQLPEKGGKKAAQLTDFQDRRGDAMAEIEFANGVPYIEDLDRGSAVNPPHHIAGKARAIAIFKMEKALTNMARKRARKWRS